MTTPHSATSNSTHRAAGQSATSSDRSHFERAHASSGGTPTASGSLALALPVSSLSDQEFQRQDATHYPAAEFNGLRRHSLPLRIVNGARTLVRWTAAAAITTALCPVFVGIGAAIFVFEGRPLFYRQYRVGRDGHLFRIWKFRTMRPNAESTTGPVWCQQEDQRVTTIGRFLRASHLDELPQLFNVLQGDMNIVGPRPERPEFVQQLAQDIPGYLGRLRVKPGITGLAQIRQGYDRCLADVRRKVALDCYYIRHASLRFDLYLVLGTIPFVARELIDRLQRRFHPAEAKSGTPVLRIVQESSSEINSEFCSRVVTPADIQRAIQHNEAAAETVQQYGSQPVGPVISPPHGGFGSRRSSASRVSSRPTQASMPYSQMRPAPASSQTPTDDPRSA